MRVNKGVAITSSAVVLVPYSKCHVPKYHSWMEDEEIREATASELLTLDEEYSMQESWRQDVDKLTFIVCPSPREGRTGRGSAEHLFGKGPVSSDCMVGDVNLFLRLEDEESTQNDTVNGSCHEPEQHLVGELELMIAEKDQRRQGYGRAALLCFLRYVLENESSIIQEFFSQGPSTMPRASRKISYLGVKIGENNFKSLALFENLGFWRVTEKANVFGELELRRDNLHARWVHELLEKHCICDFLQVPFNE